MQKMQDRNIIEKLININKGKSWLVLRKNIIEKQFQK